MLRSISSLRWICDQKFIRLLTLISIYSKIPSHMYPYLQRKKKWREKKNVINLLWKCEQTTNGAKKKNVSMLINQQHLQHNHDLNSVFSSSIHFVTLSHSVSLSHTAGEKKETGDILHTNICMKHVIKCITMKIAFCLVFSIWHRTYFSQNGS